MRRLLFVAALAAVAGLPAVPAGAVTISECAYATETEMSAGVPGEAIATAGFTADGAHVVFYVRASGGSDQLWAARTDGSSPPVRLSPVPLPLANGVQHVQIIGDRAVFVMEVEAGKAELFSEPVTGPGSQVPISPRPVLGSGVRLGGVNYAGPVIHAPGNRLVYAGDFAPGPATSLYVVPVDGSAASQEISGPAHTLIGQFKLTPNGTSAAFVADEDTPGGAWNVYRRPLDLSGAAVRIDGPPGTTYAGLGVLDFQFAGNGSRLVYLAEPYTAGERVLLTRTLPASGPAIELSDATPTGFGVSWWEVTAAGYVVYYGQIDDSLYDDLYATSVDGLTPIRRLSSIFQPNGDVLSFLLTPDGSRVVYQGNLHSAGRIDLYSNTVATGSSLTQLRLTGASGTGMWNAQGYRLAAGGSRVVFLGDLDGSGTRDIHSVAIMNAADAVLDQGEMGDVESWVMSPNGTTVAYVGALRTAGVTEAFASAVAGSTHRVLNDAPVAGGDVDLFSLRYSDDSRFVLFSGDLREDTTYHAYAAGATVGTAVRLSGELPAGAFSAPGPADGPRVALLHTRTGEYEVSVGWIGDLDGDSLIDTCDPDAAPVVASITDAGGVITVMFDRPTNRAPLAGDLDDYFRPSNGHTFGGATAAWAAPTQLVVTRVADTTVGAGDTFNLTSAWGLRAIHNRSPITDGLTSAVSGAPPSPPPAAPAPPTAPLVPFACPGTPPPTPFSDVGGSFAAAEVACLYGAGIVAGTGATTYSPEAVVTRAQMAVFIMKAWEAATGVAAATAPSGQFTDIAGNFAEARIRQLVALGITSGTSATTYSPDDPVTRAQMAVFLVRLWEVLRGASPAEASTAFTDISGNFAEARIRQLVGLGVTAGTSATTYSPGDPVTRAQMAVFLVRLLTNVTA